MTKVYLFPTNSDNATTIADIKAASKVSPLQLVSPKNNTVDLPPEPPMAA